MNLKPKIVVALGGNALGSTPAEQQKIAQFTAQVLVELARSYRLVICHGNGPQVGMINLSFDLAHQHSQGKIPLLPLPEAGSMSQGYIGYHLQNAVMNELQKRQIHQHAVTLLTQVEVDPQDSAFQNPTKPIGSFYSEKEAQQLIKTKQWIMHNDAGRGWRRFVPSPQPINILEKSLIADLIAADHIVIAAGGGGIPVVRQNQVYKGISAVIDKDFAAAKLASLIRADKLVILTAVDFVSVNFGKSNQKNLGAITLKELETHLQNKQFGIGSMQPKVAAVVRFLHDNPQSTAIIASLNNASAALAETSGTVIRYN